MKRPLLWVAFPYVAGILLGNYFPLSPTLLLTSVFGLLVPALIWSRARLVLLWALLLVAGWTNLTLRTAIISPHDVRNLFNQEPQLVTIRGTLHETPSLRLFEYDEKESWRTLARLNVTAVQLHRQGWRSAVGRIAVTTPESLTNLFAGQTVEVTGVVAPPKIAATEGTFDYRAYLRQLGIYYQLRAASEKDWAIISSPGAPPLADRFRAWARHALADGLPAEDESLHLEWMLTLGWKTELTNAVFEPFVRAATYHIFAVDGLRMAIIFGIFFILFRALGLSRAVIGVVLLPLLWFYVALTGWPASAIRATVMLTIVIVGWALKRPSDLINSLFAAALIILLWEPQQLFQAGFQLSFFVVLCLILTIPAIHQLVQRLFAPDPLVPEQLRRRWPLALFVPARYVGELVVTSLAAWIGSLPLVAYYFNIITPVSTPANVVAVPLCALVLVSNFASLLLASWFPAGAELFNHAGWFLMECIRVSSHWFAKWPGAYLYVSAPSLFTSVLYYSVLLAVVTGWLFKPKLRDWKFTALALLIFVWCGLFWHDSLTTSLTILPMNGGSAVYFDAPGKKNDLLVDCGSANSVEFMTKPFLRAQGVNRLPVMALTHGDVGRIGGAELMASEFSVRQVCASPVRFRSPAYRQVLDQLSSSPEGLRMLRRDDVLGAWTILHPDPEDHFSQADDNAIVLSGTFRGTRLLLLSDLGRSGQNALLGRYPALQADIVVTGLPVQTEPLGEALLDAIQPRVIIVTDSEFPALARASSRLRGRLAKRNIPVLYTRSSGAVTIDFRSDEWELSTMSGTKIKSGG